LTTDYVSDILGLIESEWTDTNMTNLFTPSFSNKWYLGTWNVQRLITIRNLGEPHTIEDCCNAFHRIDALFQFDCWADDLTDVLDMKAEVDRIINANNNNPVTGVTFIAQRRWIDNSFIERELYRMTLELVVIYYQAT
jgi:hypothetical protein